MIHATRDPRRPPLLWRLGELLILWSAKRLIRKQGCSRSYISGRMYDMRHKLEAEVDRCFRPRTAQEWRSIFRRHGYRVDE